LKLEDLFCFGFLETFLVLVLVYFRDPFFGFADLDLDLDRDLV